jgi:hypothetical protein
MLLELIIDDGLAVLTDEAGNIRRYRRADGGVHHSNVCHAAWDEDRGCAVRTKLLESDDAFPYSLFIMHRPPLAPKPGWRQGQWARIFKYEPELTDTDTNTPHTLGFSHTADPRKW